MQRNSPRFFVLFSFLFLPPTASPTNGDAKGFVKGSMSCVAWNKNLMYAINSNACWRSCTRLPVTFTNELLCPLFFCPFFQVIRFIRPAHGWRLSGCSTGLKGTWVLAGRLAGRPAGWRSPLMFSISATDLEITSFKMRRLLSSPACDRGEAARLSSFILCRFNGAFLVSALTLPSRWPHTGRRVRSRFAEMTMIVGVRRQRRLWGKSRERLQHLWMGFMTWIKAKKQKNKTWSCQVPFSRFVFPRLRATH